MEKIQKINSRSKQLEQELLGRLFFNEKDAIAVSTLIKAEEFYFFRKEFEIILDCAINNKNLVIEFKGNNLIFSPFMETVSFRNIEIICYEIRETNNARKIYSILEESLNEIPTTNIFEFVSDFQKKITSNVEKTNIERSDIESLIKKYKEQQEFYREKFRNGNGIIGMSTGYYNLDAIIDGLREEHLWIIGGYSSVGKTAAALNITSQLVKDKKRVVYFSFEMGQIDILARLIGIMSQESGISILKGFGKKEEETKKAIQLIRESNFAIHSFKSDLAELLFAMLEETINNKVNLFVIDFIQLITVKGSRSEYETVTTAILELQKAAKRFKVPIIVLSQISNEGAKVDSPIMTFKGSGAIAAAADLAIEIKSDEKDREELKRKLIEGEEVRMKWDVRKNRHGRVGAIEMYFQGRSGIFRLLTAKEGQTEDIEKEFKLLTVKESVVEIKKEQVKIEIPLPYYNQDVLKDDDEITTADIDKAWDKI